jgi:subtilisin family serine protease
MFTAVKWQPDIRIKDGCVKPLHAPHRFVPQRFGFGLLFAFIASLFTLPVFAGSGLIHRMPEPVPNQYIVTVKEDFAKNQVPAIAQELLSVHGGKLRVVMNNIMNLFSVEMTEAQATALARHPWIADVEEVAEVHLSTIQPLPPAPPLNNLHLWNLDRIDQYGTADSNAYQYCEQARDVIAYMIDTGVMGDHQEFINPATGLSRVRTGVAYAQDGGTGNVICPTGPTPGRTGDLGWSHGTATASILGGLTVGVAKAVTIVPIRIYACQGYQGTVTTTERFAWGLDWIRSPQNPDRDTRPALLSLSAYARVNDPLIASFENEINRIVLDEYSPVGCTPGAPGCTLVWRGIPVIVSANNQARSDCQTSPARMAYRNDPSVAFPGFASPGRVISVGGTGRQTIGGVLQDVRWQCPMYPNEPCETETCDGIVYDTPQYGSNFGNMVDIYAPVHDVESAYTQTTSSYRPEIAPPPGLPGPYYPDDSYHIVKSGTSFAAPLAAGVVARILQVQQNLTPRQVWDQLRTLAFHVPVPFDTAGVDQNHNPTSNDLLLMWRYASAQCAVEYP